jgi:hypothetical protein
MAFGRRHAAAIVGLGALGAAAAALLVGGASDARRAAGMTASERALAAAQAAVAESARDLADEAVAAGAVPQLNVALHGKVDTFTLDHLFQTEDWWASHRARAVVIMGRDGVFMSHNVRGGAAAAAVLAAHAGEHQTVRLARVGDEAYLVAAGAVVIPGTVVAPDALGYALVLGLPVDSALVERWAGTARAGLVLTDGHGFERAGGALRPPSAALVGREAEPVVLDDKGTWAAGSMQLGEGLRLWALRPLPADAGKTPGPLLWAGAGALALGALGLALAGRKRASTPVTSPADVG